MSQVTETHVINACRRLFGSENAELYVKDGVNDFIVEGKQDAVKPAGSGTKSALHYRSTVAPGQTFSIRMRLSDREILQRSPTEDEFERKFAERKKEAEVFYASIIPRTVSEDRKNVTRQARAGMLWSNQ